MQKYFFILFTLLLGVADIAAQEFENEDPAVLQNKINHAAADSNKVKYLLARSRQLLFKAGALPTDIDSSFEIMQQASRLSIQLNDVHCQGNSALMAALIYNKKGDRGKGLQLTQNALQMFTSVNDFKGEAEANIIIGQHYKDEGADLPVKIGYYQKAIAIFAQIGAVERQASAMVDLADLQSDDTQDYIPSYQTAVAALSLYQSIGYKRLHGLYSLLGAILKELGDPATSLKYQLLAISTAEEFRDSAQLDAIYNHAGLTYVALKKWPEAVTYLEKGLSLARQYHDTSAITSISGNLMSVYNTENNFLRTMALYETWSALTIQKPGLRSLVVINTNMLDIYIKRRDYKMAGVFFDRIRNLTGNNTLLRPQYIVTYINYYILTHQFNAGYKLLDSMRGMYQQLILTDKRRIELAAFRLDSATGKFEHAIQHYQRMKVLDDSVFNIAKNRQVAFFQVSFETQQKEKDIQALKKQALLQQQATKATLNLWVGGTGALVLLLGIGYNRFRLKQRKNLELQKRQDKIDRQNAALQHLVDEKDLLLVEKDNLLTEKEWLLKEINHRVKNNLQIVMGLLQQQSAYISNEAALAAIQNSENRMRSISLIHHKLYQSDSLNLICMPEYIDELISYLRDSFDLGNRVYFEKRVDKIYLDVSQAVPLGLILNEAITNAIKYGYPNNASGIIYVSLRHISEEMNILTIRDCGPGLPLHFDLIKIESLGLNLMRGLCKQLHGNFEISNDNGVIIKVVFKTDTSICVYSNKIIGGSLTESL